MSTATVTINDGLAHLVDHVPTWLRHLDDLTQQISRRHSELTQLSVRQLKPRNGSTESLRPRANAAAHGVDEEPPTVADPASAAAAAAAAAAVGMRPHATLPPPLRRKRKTESIASNMEPTKYRTRSMIIVYYDSAVQEAFEAVVRNVSTARNLLRKGRMAAKMKQVTALPDELASLLGSDESALVSSRLAFSRMSRARGGGGDEKTIFDTIDQALEASQSFCEHGAHQFLRDGDCAAEIASIKLKLGEVRTLAQAEWTRLAKEEATTAPPAHDLEPEKAAVVDAKMPSPPSSPLDHAPANPADASPVIRGTTPHPVTMEVDPDY